MKYKCTKKYPKLDVFVYSFIFNFQIFLIKRAVNEHPGGPLLDPQPVCLTPLI